MLCLVAMCNASNALETWAGTASTALKSFADFSFPTFNASPAGAAVH
jgi:hypothetical protein